MSSFIYKPFVTMDVDQEPVHVDIFIAINHFNQCVMDGNFREIIRLLDDGYNVNFFDATGLTALHHAVNQGNMHLIKFLLEKGANITARTFSGVSVMMFVVMAGNVEIFDFFAAKFASRSEPVPLDSMCHVNSRGETLLMLACSHGHPHMVQRLIQVGFDPWHVDESGQTSLHHSVPREGGRFTIPPDRERGVILVLLKSTTPSLEFINTKDYDGNTALHKACRINNDTLKFGSLSNFLYPHRPIRYNVPLDREAVVKILLVHGASILLPNSKLETALHIAVTNSANCNFVATLCHAGANSGAQDEKGRTPFHIAMSMTHQHDPGDLHNFNSLSCIQTMCASDKGFNESYFKIRDHQGMTPRLVAYKSRNYDAARWERLSPRYFYNDDTDINGDGPLHYTVRTHAMDEVRWLLNHGANIHARNMAGMSPSDIADSYLGGECKSLFDGIYQETQNRSLSLAMGHHRRLGATSILTELSPELLRDVHKYM